MKERYCADALTKEGPYDPEMECIDWDRAEYTQFCAPTENEATRLAEKADLNGEHHFVERQLDHPIYGWMHDDYINECEV